jgi:hypothetical protein
MIFVAALNFGVTREGYLALRRILESRPFGSMPNVKHSCYFTGGYGRDTISVRIEEGMNGRKTWFNCLTSLVCNLLWFLRMEDVRHAEALKRVAELLRPDYRQTGTWKMEFCLDWRQTTGSGRMGANRRNELRLS